MNAEQKKRIAHEISNWKNACNCRAVQLTGDRMAALLQELIDAPEAPTKNQSEQHLEMVKRELFQARQAEMIDAWNNDDMSRDCEHGQLAQSYNIYNLKHQLKAAHEQHNKLLETLELTADMLDMIGQHPQTVANIRRIIAAT